MLFRSCFKGAFYGVDDFNKYVGSLREGRLSHYHFIVREMTAKIDDGVFWEGEGKCVKLHNCDCDVSLLPKDAQTLNQMKQLTNLLLSTSISASVLCFFSFLHL